MSAWIGPIGTARPPVSLTQEAILSLGVVPTNTEDSSRQRTLFRRTGVSQRSLVVAADPEESWFFRPGAPAPTTAERMGVYRELAAPLAAEACHAAMSRDGAGPESITHLVTASCTGFAAPGVDAEIIQRLGLPPTTMRTNVGFMGCHAAVNALRIGAALVEADPAARALVCCVELCSIHLQHEESPERDIVNALFADGAGACVVSAHSGDGSLGRIRSTSARLWPEAAGLMRWDITDTGFRMRLGRETPDRLRESVGPWVRDWLAGVGVRIEDVPSWAIHPGGPSVISAVRDGLGLEEGQCEASRAVLSDAGNMSSATLLFVLDALAKGGAPGPMAALAFGPGLAGEGLLLDRPKA